jgi:hypothetical protein
LSRARLEGSRQGYLSAFQNASDLRHPLDFQRRARLEAQLFSFVAVCKDGIAALTGLTRTALVWPLSGGLLRSVSGTHTDRAFACCLLADRSRASSSNCRFWLPLLVQGTSGHVRPPGLPGVRGLVDRAPSVRDSLRDSRVPRGAVESGLERSYFGSTKPSAAWKRDRF